MPLGKGTGGSALLKASW